MGEWSVEFTNAASLAALEELLRDGSGLLTERAVGRIGSLKIEVLSDEHAPPHFRVSYQGETANYKISDCAKISGGLDRFHGDIKGWHAANKELLIRTWNESRPTDCPVGEYREPVSDSESDQKGR